jgi:hypothetical protein
MSSLIVEVCEVAEVTPHPNADRMAVAKIKGWYVCVAKDAVTGEPWCKAGDKVVYFPPDAVLQPEVSDKHGVTKYLGLLPKNEDGTRPPGGRVMVANLRGFKSYGFASPPDDPTWPVGTDVAAHYGVTKYEPPLKANQGDAERPHAAFHRYYDMENIRNFLDVFTDGEEIVCTEKIHGENCRLGLIRDTNDKGEAVWKWTAGTHDVRRKQFWQKQDADGNPVGDVKTSAPWMCFNDNIRQLLADLSGCGYDPAEIDKEPLVKDDMGYNVVLFGERFGCVQDMHYGFSNGGFGFRAFDVTVNGNYLDYDTKKQMFAKAGVEMVPEVYRGPYSFAKIEELAEGPTLVTDKPGKHTFREGVVVLSVKERAAITEKKVMSRAQLKCISFAYLSRKEGTEFH